MAGIVFKNKTHVLMGHKLHEGIITGIGGKPIGDESPIRTAFREAVEEIFGVQPSVWMIDGLVNEYYDRAMVDNKGYKMFILSFEDILTFMNIVAGWFSVSPFYHTFPKTLDDLILTRRAPKNVEIVDLALLPITTDHFHVDQRDMRILLTQ
jgi:hypothetical protein